MSNEQTSTMVELLTGTKVWVLNPQDLDVFDFDWNKAILYRDNDLPAIEGSDGTKEWFQNGKIHRDNDLPAIEYPSGTKEWYQNGKFVKDNF